MGVSIVEMYPAEYVLTYGDLADHADSTEMIRSSPIRPAADLGRDQMRRMTDTTVPSTIASSPSRTG